MNGEGVALFIERDLGNERISVLMSKAEAYSGHYKPNRLINVGFVVESARRAAAIRRRLAAWYEREVYAGYEKAPCSVAVAADLIADPFGRVWQAPDGRELAAFELPSFEPNAELPLLQPGCFADEECGFEALDDRLLDFVGDLGHAWS